MEQKKTVKITVQTTVQVPVEKAWKYWTGPEHIINWNFASDDWCCPSAATDLRVNGKFTSRMEARDGSMGFDFEGIFEEIKPNALIKYGLGDQRKVEVRFETVKNATRITEIFDAENENPVELQRQGWQAILENFRKYAENQ